ncbi:hypothetical protein FRX31_025062 [Thalictrum thalictroides]|uniref:Uncharacterized protein n=1 Tax=Thalictrum thalictroides TaxID=46969 RepID=A0A7J6VKQ7_THATH|nr:hypothetical protein FRX31_025062 [Thalictrum thalictroides]
MRNAKKTAEVTLHHNSLPQIVETSLHHKLITMRTCEFLSPIDGLTMEPPSSIRCEILQACRTAEVIIRCR